MDYTLKPIRKLWKVHPECPLDLIQMAVWETEVLHTSAGDTHSKSMDTESLYSHDFLPEEFYNMLSLFQWTQTDISPLQTHVKAVAYVPMTANNDSATEPCHERPLSIYKLLLQILKASFIIWVFFLKTDAGRFHGWFFWLQWHFPFRSQASPFRQTFSSLEDVPHLRRSSTELELGGRLWSQTFWVWNRTRLSHSCVTPAVQTVVITLPSVGDRNNNRQQRRIRRSTQVNMSEGISDSV